MNPAKILLLPYNSRVEKSATKICSPSLEGRPLQDLPALDFCCSLMGLQETYSVFMALHRLPLDFCDPQRPTCSAWHSFCISLFRILQTRSWIFILVLRWFCPEKSSQPSKGCPLHSWSGILCIFHRPCVVKVTLGHAMNTRELRSWSDLSFWCYASLCCDQLAFLTRASVAADLQVCSCFSCQAFVFGKLWLCLRLYKTQVPVLHIYHHPSEPYSTHRWGDYLSLAKTNEMSLYMLNIFMS